MNTASKQVGAFVRDARQKRCWTQSRVAEEFNSKAASRNCKPVSRQWIVNLENSMIKGRIAPEKVSLLFQILGINETEMNRANEAVATNPDEQLETSDILPLLKKIAESNLSRLTLEQFRRLCESECRLQEVGLEVSCVEVTKNP